MGTKETRIVTTEHAMLGHTGAPSDILAPGEHVVFDEEVASHKAIKADIDAGRAPHLSIQEVDLEVEQKQQEAHQKLLDDLAESDAKQAEVQSAPPAGERSTKQSAGSKSKSD